MNKRGAAIAFFAMSVMLYMGRNITHHVVAAMIGSDSGDMSSGRYQMALDLTRTYSKIPEIVAFAVGIIFMVWSILTKEK